MDNTSFVLPPPPYRTEQSVRNLLTKAQCLLDSIEYEEQFSSEVNTFTTKFHATPMQVEAACVAWLQMYGSDPSFGPDLSTTSPFLLN